MFIKIEIFKNSCSGLSNNLHKGGNIEGIVKITGKVNWKKLNRYVMQFL